MNGLTDAAAESTETVVQRIVASTQGRRSDLIPILQQIQAVYRYLPADALQHVADMLGISPATVYGVATFYAQFSLKPKGKWIIRVCNGTACHVRGSQKLLDALASRLGLTQNGNTTEDGLFTLEVVSCLGACGLAPVVVVGEHVHGQLTPEGLEILLDHLVSSEAEGEQSVESTVSGEAQLQ